MTQAIIDLAGTDDKVAREIDVACRTHGYFYIVNYGIQSSFIEAIFNVSSTFFALDREVKESLNSHNSICGRGYFGIFQEKFDNINPDCKEGFDIGIDNKSDDPYVKAGTPFYGVNAWPEDAPEFKAALTEYFDQALALGRRILQLTSLALGKNLNFFDGFMSKPMATLRILRYPPDSSTAVGAGEHTDFGLLTLVLEKDTEGIEVKDRNGQWHLLPHFSSAILVNVGDIMEILSNGAYRAIPHRVINKSCRDRYSAVFFLDPDFYAKLPQGIQSSDPVTAGGYILSKNQSILG